MERKSMIRLEGVVKRFQGRNGMMEVLHGINLNIGRGEIYGIMGLGGSGKSTLLRCINLLERPTAGRVYFQGEELTACKESKLRKHRRDMGMVFQQSHLMKQKTALENVCLPIELSGATREQAKEKARGLLQRVGMVDKAGLYPMEMSASQKQRTAIARALATEPKVLLCDEVTASLEPATVSDTLHLLRELNRSLGITIILVTHEMSVIRAICDRVAIIDGGFVVEEGTVEEVFLTPKTQIGREIVFHDGAKTASSVGNLKHCYRLVCKGGDITNDPIIGRMMIDCHEVVNVISANMRNIDEQVFGQMILQFPENKWKREKMIKYLKDRGAEVEEVDYV